MQYQFSVGGLEYKGDRYRLWPIRFRTEEDARAAISNLHAGQETRVFYDASSIDKNVLIPGADRYTLMAFIVGWVVIIASLWFALNRWRHFTNLEPSPLYRAFPKVQAVVCSVVGFSLLAFNFNQKVLNSPSARRLADANRQAAESSETHLLATNAIQAVLDELHAFQEANENPDRLFDEVMRKIWRENHPKTEPPWKVKFGNADNWWYSREDWDVDEVKARLLKAVSDSNQDFSK
ncbi:hypothetical protein Mal15_08540 [Stieleria maiorica]|uniref:DUF3592 domain-containing protein n=1 Tax=Stieleria maiorica TaxID=2795974 RepID=A0A5B9MBA1_9BACT|nr:hypothetical protein [Stieleria maiorica]QEF96824.1 hypothetical protein Mal15_08540 [Stieleria maiorica]